MKDFVVYHNPDSMGKDVRSVGALSIVTNKPVDEVKGDRVGLLTGEGVPRSYFLRSWFIIDDVQTNVEGFKTKLSGEKGKVFEPMVELNREEWFKDFKRSQGNFSLGLQRIKDERFIRGLESLAEARIITLKPFPSRAKKDTE